MALGVCAILFPERAINFLTSPEIAHEIFKKIAAATVVVADVTPVGRGPDRPDKDGKPQNPKPLMNPNVAIELGYAYGKLNTESFLAVLNEAYGDVDSLPFSTPSNSL